MKTKKEKLISLIISVIAVAAVALFWYFKQQSLPDYVKNPPADNKAYVVVNDNVPNLSVNGSPQSFETYADLDQLGRCGVAYACIGIDLMPTQDRESISEVKPSGWNQKQYDFVDGNSLYNRCHLIGFQLTGENANERNLITGTRYLNTKGMLPFENMIADYVKETENHVLYRVTPVFVGSELVARGVQMEALSVEDGGEGISFNIFAYNIQPGVIINYADGSNYSRTESEDALTVPGDSASDVDYIINIKGKKFHLGSCKQAQDIRQDNRKLFSGSREELLEQGYTPAGCCKP